MCHEYLRFYFILPDFVIVCRKKLFRGIKSLGLRKQKEDHWLYVVHILKKKKHFFELN